MSDRQNRPELLRAIDEHFRERGPEVKTMQEFVATDLTPFVLNHLHADYSQGKVDTATIARYTAALTTLPQMLFTLQGLMEFLVTAYRQAAEED